MSELITDSETFDPAYYSTVYIQIQDIIISSYLDYYIIEFYKRQDDETQREQSKHLILHHVIDLVKRDLCLNLWKICYDTNQGSSTINNLNAYLRKCKLETKNKKSPYWKSLQTQIVEARNKYVAHSDVVRVSNKISVESMKHLLDDARAMLNSLCYEEHGVKTITDEALLMLDLKTVMGANTLLNSKHTV